MTDAASPRVIARSLAGRRSPRVVNERARSLDEPLRR